ncbi:MAG: dGTP triphosphohydrolase [Methanomethylophilus alvi]|nr:MAG: dGTP triphosphohydrolase [Methanomethylophilus alvi]
MNGKVKTVYDPVHGAVNVDGICLDILDRREMQRLRGVRQLGLGYYVFPGANHTRFEHCLGTYHIACRMSDALGLSGEDSDAVRTAALMHDICHSPFSHTLEGVMEEATGLDHMELARNLITGRGKYYLDRDGDICGGSEPIGSILEDAGIDAQEVCDLIAFPESTERDLDMMRFDGPVDHFPSKDYIHQIIHGPVDADQMDYLLRDAHYTGVVMGKIDLDRLLTTMRVVNDRICISRNGAPAAEGLMVSRALMYSSVYFHPTAKIIERMVVKAVCAAEDLDLSDIYLWDDSDMTQALISYGGVPSKLMRSILGRRFYKRALTVSEQDTGDDLIALLGRYSGFRERLDLEKAIADRAGIDVSEVAVISAPPSVMKTQVKIGKTDVSIVDPDGKVRSLTRTSAIAKALQSREPYGWTVQVACPEGRKEAVAKAASKVLGL